MTDQPARIRDALDLLADRAATAPGDPDAGFSTAVAAAAMFAVADTMRQLTAEVSLVADNMKAAGSIYDSTDDAIQDAVQRAGGGPP